MFQMSLSVEAFHQTWSNLKKKKKEKKRKKARGKIIQGFKKEGKISPASLISHF